MIVDVKVMKAWPIFLVTHRIHLFGFWKQYFFFGIQTFIVFLIGLQN